ncbi:MAG TPA: hypothetical protein VGZ47_08205 [Gemmataceae bacterium]|nr:hypothetical protein [Gemmataceae bacterium]
MMRCRFAAAVSLFVLVASSQAQNQPMAPKSPAPSFAFVHDLDKSQNIVYVQTIELVPREESRVVNKSVEQNGRKVTVPEEIKVTVYVPVTRITKWDAGKNTAINTAGKKLSPGQLFQQLKAGDTILIYTSESVDPSFLKPLKENVVLLQMQPPPVILKPQLAPEPIPGPKQ